MPKLAVYKNILILFKTEKYENLLLWIIWLDRLLHLRTDLHSCWAEEWGLSCCLWKYCQDRCLCSLVYSCAFTAKLSGLNSLTFIPELFLSLVTSKFTFTVKQKTGFNCILLKEGRMSADKTGSELCSGNYCGLWS